MPAAKLSIRARWEATFFFFHHRSKYSAAINPEVPKTQGVCIHWTGQLDWTTELTFCHIKKIYRYTIRLSTSLANALKPPQGDTCSLVSCQLVCVCHSCHSSTITVMKYAWAWSIRWSVHGVWLIECLKGNKWGLRTVQLCTKCRQRSITPIPKICDVRKIQVEASIKAKGQPYYYLSVTELLSRNGWAHPFDAICRQKGIGHQEAISYRLV